MTEIKQEAIVTHTSDCDMIIYVELQGMSSSPTDLPSISWPLSLYIKPEQRNNFLNGQKVEVTIRKL